MPKYATNVYTCNKCKGRTVTIDIDEGVTPFMLNCRASGDEETCNGMAESSFYNNPLNLEPQWEWYRPDTIERANSSIGMREHANKGGLFIRKRRI